MQNLNQRLQWRNLSLQAKFALMLAVQVLLIVIVVVIALVTQDNVRQQVQTIISTTGRVAQLSQDLQLASEQLGTTHNRLLDEFNDAGFSTQTTNLFEEHTDFVTRIREQANELETLLLNLTDEDASENLSTTADQVLQDVQRVDETFARVENLVFTLAQEDGGALDVLTRRGDELQDLAIQQADATDAEVGNELVNQVLLLRSIENRLVESAAEEDLALVRDTVEDINRTYNRIPDEDQVFDIPSAATAYLNQTEEVYGLLEELEIEGDALRLARQRLGSTLSRFVNIGTVESRELTQQIAVQEDRAQLTVILSLAAAIGISATLMFLFGRGLLRRINPLLEATRRLETGDLEARAPVIGEDEFSRLSMSFNAMALQLEGLFGSLEQRVAEATRDLTITAEIGQAVVDLRNPRELMDEVVELIRDRFNFYHAQVFLVDDERENAVLYASTGTAGRELLARQHSLGIGSQSVIGQVTDTAEPVIALDTDADRVHRRNELLPDTRSEMALPMRIGDRVIGALDVQSIAPNAFDEDDVAVFQIMADQLAISVENARLFTRLDEAQNRLERVQQRITTEAWVNYQQGRTRRGTFGYEKVGERVREMQGEAPDLVDQAVRSGQITRSANGEDIGLAIPIRVRGEVVGAFGFGGDGMQELTDEDMLLIDAVMERVGLALDNLRLVEQTTRRAEYEQIVNEITEKIIGSTDVDFILRTTVQELGRILRAPQTSVQLRREAE